uniref:Uncharacterized protein n=1 Tax=Setaria viridis TaxID=4556 RepID=A0A4U6VF62_SETVI|nr:hypothetical protein SEVIR_3G151600v2 [Setaria viridis]
MLWGSRFGRSRAWKSARRNDPADPSARARPRPRASRPARRPPHGCRSPAQRFRRSPATAGRRLTRPAPSEHAVALPCLCRAPLRPRARPAAALSNTCPRARLPEHRRLQPQPRQLLPVSPVTRPGKANVTAHACSFRPCLHASSAAPPSLLCPPMASPPLMAVAAPRLPSGPARQSHGPASFAASP